jgi:hypothetical protein
MTWHLYDPLEDDKASVQTRGNDVSMPTWPNDSVPCGMLIWHFFSPNILTKLCHVVPPRVSIGHHLGDAAWKVQRVGTSRYSQQVHGRYSQQVKLG